MKVGYVVNQYPKVSHSFIRREILELEAQGVRVSRLSVRGWSDPLVDPTDITEREKTFFVLQQPYGNIVLSVIAAIYRHPRGFWSALGMCFRMMRHSSRGPLYHFAYLVEACVTASRFKSECVEHIHAHFGTNSAEVALFAHLLMDIPFSFTVHGPEEFDSAGFLGLREKIAAAEFVCAISSFGRGQLFRWSDQKHWSKIKIVRCGLDDYFTASPPPPAGPSRMLVCVGRLCEQKGQLILLEAAARLAREGRDFSLVFAGDGEQRSEIERLTRELGLSDRVTITGWVSSKEVRDLISRSRALVLPSLAEGIPVVIMEAMALRRPVLSTYVAGIPELVAHGVTGWLVPAGSSDAVADAMREILDASEEQLFEMGINGRKRALEAHNIVTEVNQLAQLMKSTAEVHRSVPSQELLAISA